jgi:hypothetical protein
MPVSFTSSNIFLLCAALFYPSRIDIVQTDKLCCHLGGEAVIEFHDELKATQLSFLALAAVASTVKLKFLIKTEQQD